MYPGSNNKNKIGSMLSNPRWKNYSNTNRDKLISDELNSEPFKVKDDIIRQEGGGGRVPVKKLITQQPLTTYASIEPIQHIYPIHDSLNKIDTFVPYDNTRINMCTYMIKSHKSTGMPFLQYLLYKYPESHKDSNKLVFPFFKYKGGDILSQCEEKYYDIFQEFDIKKKDLKSILLIKGYLERRGEIYVFAEFVDSCILIQEGLHISYKQTYTPKLSVKTSWWWTTMYEIKDSKMTMDYPIHPSVTDFFLENQQFIKLLDSKTKQDLEEPIIVYYGQNKNIEFNAIFGVPKSKPSVYMGPYYYYTIFEKAVEYAQRPIEQGKIDKLQGGIIRFALFTNKMKITLERFNKKYQVDTTWISEGYDSVFLERCSEKHMYPIWVVKTYTQAIPLSYHLIE